MENYKTIVKYIIAFFCNLLYHALLVFAKSYPHGDRKYHVSICAIFKNESSFLKEWIEFHKIVGINHFYLYNNESSDNYLDVLKPYIEEGIVSLIEWPYSHSQIQAYKHFYENYRNETQWVSFLDIDEFICPKYVQTVGEWLIPYKKYPSIVIYWKMFGTSGLMKHDYNSLVTEQYTVCWDKLYHVGKCLINTTYDIAVYDATTHHSPTMIIKIFGVKIKISSINQFKYFIKYNIFFGTKKESENSTIQINHYWSKAWDIYNEKRERSDVFFKENPKKNISYFYWHENENRDSDHTIFRYLINLKMNMNYKT
jgi:hypothetical protein